MAYFEDLSRCDYFGSFAPEAQLIAVGWLDHLHPISTGTVPDGVMSRLVDFLKDPCDFISFWGYHQCEICRPEGVQLPPSPTREQIAEELSRDSKLFPGLDLGSANLFIPVPGRLEIYVAPSLIVHYIRSHDYFPPLQFQEALMKCPEMNSSSYLASMQSRGLTLNY